MKNLNYKWVLLIGAVLGLIVGTFNKEDDWKIISKERGLIRTNQTTGETWVLSTSINNQEWRRQAKPIHGFKSWFE